MKLASHRHGGFTLIESMIVLGIIVIIMSIGVPAFVKTFERKPLQQAVNDMMEGLKQARATAILSGTPAEFVIRAGDGSMSVRSVGGEPAADADTRLASEAPKGFQARLADSIIVEMLDVNFQDRMQSEEASVRFHPNGTSDEFTIVMRSPEGEWRKISLEPITGLAALEVDANKFLKR